MRLLQSDLVRYKTMDIVKGNVAEAIRKTLDLARDLRVKLDDELKTLLTGTLANGGCFGPFGYETANGSLKSGNKNKSTRVYLAHSHVKVANLPTTNDIDLTATAKAAATVQGVANVVPNPMSSTSGGNFTWLVPKAIIHYTNLWRGLIPNSASDLVPTGEILVPSPDIIQLADVNDPTVNVSAQRIQEDINRDGYFKIHYLGMDWRFIPCNDLDAGTCYPRFNLLPGSMWTKPVWDMEQVETNLWENWEKRGVRKAYAACIISQNRPRALRIKYA
jgi:hypothetical protein